MVKSHRADYGKAPPPGGVVATLGASPPWLYLRQWGTVKGAGGAGLALSVAGKGFCESECVQVSAPFRAGGAEHRDSCSPVTRTGLVSTELVSFSQESGKVQLC